MRTKEDVDALKRREKEERIDLFRWNSLAWPMTLLALAGLASFIGILIGMFIWP